MKVSKNLFAVIAAIMIVVAIIGPLDQKAHTFIKGATEKTMKFHSLISDVRIVLAGLSKINVPFISGHTEDLGESLGKAKDYLLKISAVVFSQLMLLSISQTWAFKLLLLILFALYLSKKSSLLSAKFLIMLLAINPGLSIYSSGVAYISEKSAIDFGANYLTKLETQVTAIKNEKSQLMEQHEQQRAQERNGQKHVNIFGKLKEDVSYDFKKVGDDIKGGFAHIRLLIHEAGHEMTMKVYNFCTMILFSFLLLPMGYGLIIYVLYKNTFHSVSVVINDGKQLLAEGESDVKKLPLTTRIANALKAAWGELIAVPKKIAEDIEDDVEHVKDRVHTIEDDVRRDITGEISNMRQTLQQEIQQLHSLVHAKVTHAENDVKSDVQDVDAKLSEDVRGAEGDVKNTVEDVSARVHEDVDTVKTDISETGHNIVKDVAGTEDTIRGKVHDFAQEVKARVDDDENVIIDDANQLKDQIRQSTDHVSQTVVHKVSGLESDIDDDIHRAKGMVADDIHDVEHTGQAAISDTKARIEGVPTDVHNAITDDTEQIRDDASSIEGQIESSAQDAKQDIDNEKDSVANEANDIGDQAQKDADEIKDKLHRDGNDPLISI